MKSKVHWASETDSGIFYHIVFCKQRWKTNDSVLLLQPVFNSKITCKRCRSKYKKLTKGTKK